MRKNTVSSTSTTREEFDDGRSYDPKAVRVITQEWVDENMKSREADFSTTIGASIFCGTWNVNAKKQDVGLEEWLLPPGSKVCDLYAVGFQEIVDLNAVNVALDNSKSQQRAQFWQDLIASSLSTTGINFRLVTSRVMVGLLICIYVKDQLYNRISDVRESQLGVGLMGMMGNKGGVCVSLCFYDSSICFVCTHLAAHRENVAGRNNDFKNIIEKTSFIAENTANMTDNSLRGDLNDMVVRPRHGAAKSFGVDLSITDHEFIFWIGDLNYRIDDELSIDEIFNKIKLVDYEYLRNKDQLNIQRRLGNVFQGFSEGELKFAPTYKYQPGTNEYEARPDKKKRAPAWCDRVLWRTAAGVSPENVKLLEYRRSELLPSDHKPVMASFDCKMKSIISETENQVYKQLMNELELFRDDTKIPVATVSENILNFGDVKYEVYYERTLIITNTGSAVVYWHMTSKLEDSRVSKRWSLFSPKRGLLLPERSVAVDVKIKIDRLTAQLINSGQETLEDIIVLRIERAADIYIAVTANYQRSCYGVSLEELVCTTEPFRNTTFPVRIQPLYDVAAPDQTSRPNAALKQAIPKELWRLVDALWTGGALREKDLFGQVADKDELLAVREALDCGIDFPVCSPHAIAEALVSFLEALPKPIVPNELLPTAPLEGVNMQGWCRRLLETISPLSYNVLVYTLSFLREVLEMAEYNRTSPTLLAGVCLRCFASSTDSLPNNNSFSTKEERIKREQRLAFFQDALVYMLITQSI